MEHEHEDEVMHFTLTVRQVRLLNRLGWARYSRISDKPHFRSERLALAGFLGESDRKLRTHDCLYQREP